MGLTQRNAVITDGLILTGSVDERGSPSGSAGGRSYRRLRASPRGARFRCLREIPGTHRFPSEKPCGDGPF
jgi:hypothetical protein